ncbi:OmpA family protein [Geomesophilobacter sediminis]|uniref:OmpA family protein n=1 Tax=Geomesophilobacter sediminis TaxID=2798584 RepID=A0A8J7M1M1_9BACT|nr:OmpA family protein [Geomesophilobacter sediminis]MBJ6726994.1 OmpA family protein [Geomesophilobacter sediminis]
MMRNLSCLVAVLCAVFQLTGCVSNETYRVKEQEAARLGKSLEEQQGEGKKLAARNEQCQGEVQRLSGDLKTVQGERDALATSKKGLEESLRSTADSKNARIAELSQTLGEQQTENKRLKDELVRQQKLKELEVQKTSKTYEDLLDKMKGEISKGEITISELKGKLTVNVVESVLFDSGKAEVKPEGKAVLFKVVDILKTLKDKAIRVEGHTDNVQIGGELVRRYPTNWELSAARAINVTRYLQQNGIDPHLLAAVAFGEYHPVASNDTPEDRAKNRRIEITLVSNE